MLTLTAAFALEITDVAWKGDRYTVVRVDPEDRMELVGQRNAAERTLAGALAAHPDARVAMNAGMYHVGHVPVGLHVERGMPYAPVEPRALDGNFGMLPNGVFEMTPDGPAVVETRAWVAGPRDTLYATQSGPLLVADGELHPALRPDSSNRRIRNAVGVDADGRSWLVVSRGEVRFHDLATLLRDRLGCPDALYLDGTVSELATPETAALASRTFSGVLLVFPANQDRPDVTSFSRNAGR